MATVKLSDTGAIIKTAYEGQTDAKVNNLTADDISETVDKQFVSQTDKDNWDNFQGFSGDYSDLTNKPSIPTKTSQITNDSGFVSDGGLVGTKTVNEAGIGDGKVLKFNELNNELQYISLPAPFSKEYNDLLNKPFIATKISELENDSNFVSDGSLIGTKSVNEIGLSDDSVMVYDTLSDTYKPKSYQSFSGDYEDLTSKPTIPADINDLTDLAHKLNGNVGSVEVDDGTIGAGTFLKYNPVTGKAEWTAFSAPTNIDEPTYISELYNDVGYVIDGGKIGSKKVNESGLTGNGMLVYDFAVSQWKVVPQSQLTNIVSTVESGTILDGTINEFLKQITIDATYATIGDLPTSQSEDFIAYIEDVKEIYTYKTSTGWTKKFDLSNAHNHAEFYKLAGYDVDLMSVAHGKALVYDSVENKFIAKEIKLTDGDANDNQTAIEVPFDNTTSSITATDVQTALVEVNNKILADKVTNISLVGNILTYVNELNQTQTIDLSPYLDDTKVVSANLLNGVITFTNSDTTSFTLDVNDLLDDTNLITSVSGRTGDIVLVENDITNLDKYTQVETNALLSAKQTILSEGAFVDGDKTKLDNVPLDTNNELLNKVTKVTSTDDAIVAFNGITGDIKDTDLTKTDLDTYIGKVGFSRINPDLATVGFNSVNWAGGVVPTGEVGFSTLGGLAGAVVGAWNKAYTAVQKVTSTDNAIVRFDGTDGTVQDSNVTIDDNGVLEAETLIEKSTRYFPLSNTATDPVSASFDSISNPYTFVPNDGIYFDTPPTSFASLFSGNTTINDPDISTWNTSNIRNMSYMFRSATAFNQPLNGWVVSNVTNMRSMFQEASSFNQDLTDWDTSNVTIMIKMFSGATSFNGLLQFDTSNVTSMLLMFQNASAFNGNISYWNVENVANIRLMFDGATSFNQDLSSWYVGKDDPSTDIGIATATDWVLPKPNIGITEVPYNLEVNGSMDVNFDDPVGVNAIFSNTDTSSAQTITFKGDVQEWNLGGSNSLNPVKGNAFFLVNVTSGTIPFVVDSNDNVGIGTTDPETKLHLDMGDANLTAKTDIFRTDFVLQAGLNTETATAKISLGETKAGLTNLNAGSMDFEVDCTFGITEMIKTYRFIGEGSTKDVVIKDGNVGIGVDTPTAKLEVDGYTKLGADAPAIKFKKLTGTTGATEGANTIVPHGLDATKIVGYQYTVHYDGTLSSGSEAGDLTSGYKSYCYYAGANFNVKLSDTESEQILNRPFTILVTYEQ